MALALRQVLPRVASRLDATEVEDDGVRGAVGRTLRLTAIDGGEGADVLAGAARPMLLRLGIEPTEQRVELMMAALVTVLLAGYEVGCSVGEGETSGC